MGKQLTIVSLAALSLVWLPAPASARTHQVEVKNATPYCLSLVSVALPGDDPAQGTFVHFPGPPKTNVQSHKTIVGTYELPKPAKTIEVQAGPCTPTAAVPRKFATAAQAGRERNVFTIVPGPEKTIRVK